MEILRKRMARLVAELLRRDDIPTDQRFAAILLAMDAAGLPRGRDQIERMRAYWQEAVEKRRVHRRIS